MKLWDEEENGTETENNTLTRMSLGLNNRKYTMQFLNHSQNAPLKMFVNKIFTILTYDLLP